MKTAFVLVDVQKDYFPGGAFPLPDMDKVSAQCAALLQKAREHQVPVVHIRHEFPEGKGPFLCANTPGVDIHDSVAPREGEKVITKQFPNSFTGTELHDYLQEVGCQHVVLVGAMTQMCIDATTRGALDRAYQVTVCADAVGAQVVDGMGVKLDTQQVNAAFLSALGMAQARIVPSSEVAAEWPSAS